MKERRKTRIGRVNASTGNERGRERKEGSKTDKCQLIL